MQIIYENLSYNQTKKVVNAVNESSEYSCGVMVPNKGKPIFESNGKEIAIIGDGYSIKLTDINNSLGEKDLRFAKFCQKQLGRSPKGISLDQLANYEKIMAKEEKEGEKQIKRAYNLVNRIGEQLRLY